MEVFEAIEKRRSIRAYQDAPVTEEQLARFLEAVRLAPSWKNKQCWNAIVLTDRQDILTLGELLRWNPGRAVFDTVPCFVVFTADPGKSGVRDDKPYYMTDIGIAMENAVLAATEMGLGTCWVGAFTEGPIKEFLGIPEELHIVALTPLGIPAEEPEPRPRKAMEELAFGERWRGQYPSCVKSWEENWEVLSTFFEYPLEIRKIIYTTNIIEGLNRQFLHVSLSFS